MRCSVLLLGCSLPLSSPLTVASSSPLLRFTTAYFWSLICTLEYSNKGTNQGQQGLATVHSLQLLPPLLCSAQTSQRATDQEVKKATQSKS